MRWSEFPVRSAVAGIDPAVAATLPKNYAGSCEDTNIVRAFVKALESRSYKEIVDATPAGRLAEYVTTGSSKVEQFYGRTFARYALSADDESIYWDFYATVGHDLNRGQVAYLVNLAAHYEGSELQKRLSSIQRIYRDQIRVENVAPAEILYPSVASLEKLFTLSDALRFEGLVLSTHELWLASNCWSTAEIIEILSGGTTLDEAIKLYQLGYTTPEEVEGGMNIPESWMELIFSDEIPDDILVDTDFA